MSRAIYGVAILFFTYLIGREIYLMANMPVDMVYGSSIRTDPYINSKYVTSISPNLLTDSQVYTQVHTQAQSIKTSYKPNKSGSGGLMPLNGVHERERKALLPLQTDVGWWNGDIEYPVNTVREIYDREEIPERVVSSVGHWSA